MVGCAWSNSAYPAALPRPGGLATFSLSVAAGGFTHSAFSSATSNPDSTFHGGRLVQYQLPQHQWDDALDDGDGARSRVWGRAPGS